MNCACHWQPDVVPFAEKNSSLNEQAPFSGAVSEKNPCRCFCFCLISVAPYVAAAIQSQSETRVLHKKFWISCNLAFVCPCGGRRSAAGGGDGGKVRTPENCD